MKLNAPKVITWWIALALGVIGIILGFVTSLGLTTWGLGIVAVALALLLVATATKSI